MRKTKGFSYNPEKDNDVINHIDIQQNGSQYIWNLVRKDMEQNDIEIIIKKQIEKYLQGLDLSVGKSKNNIENR